MTICSVASGGTGEARAKPEWIDFSEVPERRKQPRRIQTLPAAREAAVPSYVEPDECRCECHAHAHAPPAPDDELPLLHDITCVPQYLFYRTIFVNGTIRLIASYEMAPRWAPLIRVRNGKFF